MAQKAERQDTTAFGAERRGRSRTVVGLLAGLVAAILMILVMTLLRSVLGILPPEMLPDRIAPLMPISLFFSPIGLFGGYNELKQFGVGSMLIGQIVVGTLFGLLYARLVERVRINVVDPSVDRGVWRPVEGAKPPLRLGERGGEGQSLRGRAAGYQGC